MGDYAPTDDGFPSDENIPATFSANKVVGDIYPQGADLPFQRLVDTVTGAGLFTTNSDPNVVGVDPVTGTTAPSGTDVGFAASARGYLKRNVWNGDLATPPPSTATPIGDDNVLPYWRFVQVSGTAVSATWSAGAVTLSMAAGAAGDDAAFEQLYPINRSAYQRYAYAISGYVSAAVGTDANAYLEGQFVTSDGVTTTGLAVRTEADSGTFTVVMNGTPTDAVYLRIRWGIERDVLATSGTASRTWTEVNVLEAADALYVSNYASRAGSITASASSGYFSFKTDATNTNEARIGTTANVSSPIRVVNSSSVVIGALPIGLAPYALPIGMPHDATSSGTAGLDTVTAGLGGARAIPMLVPSLMLLDSLSIWSTDTASLRTAEWFLFWDRAEGTTNNLVNVVSPLLGSPAGTFSFTPGGAASVQTSTATSAPFRLVPGVYWLVIRNTSTARTFGIGYDSAGSLNTNYARSSTGIFSPTVDIDISGWASTPNVPIVRLNGRIGSESSGFI